MALGEIKTTGFVLIFAWLTFSFNVSAQESVSLYFLPGVTQASLENPAIQNQTRKLVVGIPVLSGAYGNWDANIQLNSLFSDGFSYSLQRFYDALGERGNVRASAGMSMFYASLQHKDYSFTFSVSERALMKGNFDREIVRFVRDGTLNFFGVNENLGNASFMATQYRELALGISKQVGEKLDVGFRPKILFGKIHFEMDEVNLSVETEPGGEYLLLKPEGSFKLTGPFYPKQDSAIHFSAFAADASPGDYFFQPRNLGFALDLGVVYRPNAFSEWSLSLIDAGFIGRKYKTFNVDFVRPARYSKYNAYQSNNPGGDNYKEPREALKEFGDTASFLITINEAAKRTFTAVPVKINVAGKYHFSEKTTIGFSNQFKYYQQDPLNMFSAFLAKSFHPKFGMYGSLTLLNTSNIFPGLGASYTNNWFQLYFTSNNILGIVQPGSSKHLNLYFGVNFLFDTQ
ncbi:hypothetical protein D1164_13315 [Mariniphaga sediminis]|uniref:DUF5723 domain-containing protein n=1 Tax=Mariniphaga sediminis TaxID=1628158 RepID=A0A399D095_9BACT|nr:DUF5723 family protein [Mariniphaga sediminis]RIH64618.1 hypothetical protein D1164_13315 [Mariniphaga sediminis]